MRKTGRRPGTSTTRQEIVAAAAASFSSHGYDGTSMRQVAADAGVDPALVRRFFGGMEQLFSAVVAEVFQPDRAIVTLLDGPRGTLGRRLLGYVLSLLGDVDAPGPLLGIIRSAATNEHAAAQVREFLAADFLVKLIRTLGMDHPELRATLTASQLVGLIIARYAVRAEPLVAAGPDQLADWVAPTLQRYLTGRAPSPQPPSR
ncbi:TetR family transcriptional regulator [Nonomuraea phyllanthi]|uniref:TetR/AcrR family transcriptional regulator n=1 Tax=Nonomuraea phyllanthi TaxID=2219224 RepID=UPI0012939274|nr:TetR family transcriptional regulator [Nonomuraea phyllanthi]QFY10245.1 TetR family transcriptional regulator [Nonomuraea phyllanthi]